MLWHSAVKKGEKKCILGTTEYLPGTEKKRATSSLKGESQTLNLGGAKEGKLGSETKSRKISSKRGKKNWGEAWRNQGRKDARMRAWVS